MRNEQHHGRLAVEEAVRRVIEAAKLDARHVAQSRDPAVNAGLDHDLPEFLGFDQPALELQAGLEGLIVRHRRLPERAACNLNILLLKRADNLACGHAERGDLVGIEPGAHRIFADPVKQYAADAFHPRNHIANLQQSVVRDIELVVAAVRRQHMHDHEDVGRVLLHDDAGLAHLGRKARFRNGHAVLDENLRQIEVRAEFEGHRNRDGAVRRRLRRHIDHVLDAVDLLLDGRRDGIGRDLSVRAGIGRRHRHSRRRNIRELSDGEPQIGQSAHDNDENRNHSRENRAPDEDVAELHGSDAAFGFGSMRVFSALTLIPLRAR